MFGFRVIVVLAALAAALCAPDLYAQKKTVCTITVNSPEEKDVFRRNLPAGDFDFVELVEHGRSDWLASACRKGVQCDALIISGHFDGGTEFYSDRPGARESLPVADMERATCSESCPGVFSHLKEVYLFGCNTLNAEPLHTASAEALRGLLRSGHSPAEAEQITRTLNQAHGGSNRDRMREVFQNVPVIYGFSGKAPLGPVAGTILDRYFQSGARGEVVSGRPSAKLVSLFAPLSMTTTSGIGASEPLASHRRDMCQFVDDRLSPARKLEFVHALLGREMAEVRMFLGALDQYTEELDTSARATPEVAARLGEIGRDRPLRTRYLEFMRDADDASVRSRMIEVATRLGWLDGEERRAELMRMIGERLAARAVGPAEVDLVCDLNRDGRLSHELDRLSLRAPSTESLPQAAVLACLGSAEDHARVIRALTSGDEDAIQIAQVYLRHHPIVDAGEVRTLAGRIAAMADATGQVRALETLASLNVSDRESLEALARLFPKAKSVDVQRAIAGVLIRSDDRALAKPDLVRVLQQTRLKSPDGEDVIDVLIRRFQRS